MQSERPLLGPLASWSASNDLSQAAEVLRDSVALAVLDWFGAYAAGLAEPAADGFLSFARRCAPTQSVPGEAAFLYGAVSHLAEVDDGHRAAMMHPGIVTLSPILALARTEPVSLGAFRRAVVCGYEAAVRVGAALGAAHYRAFHSTATAGCFGAAAAAGTALRLDAERMLWAFGHAGTQASGVWQFLDDGAEAAKAAHSGFAARNGVASVLLAASGIPGARHILEGRRGLAHAWKADLDTEPLLAPFSSETSALATRTVKAWPVCGQMHHVLDAVRDHFDDVPAQPEAIESVTVESFEALARIADIRAPRTPTQARFSTSWCLAYLIVHRALGFSTLATPDALQDHEVARLAERIEICVAPEFDADYPASRSCRVTIKMQGGHTAHWTQSGRRGDPERTFSPDQMKDRFADIAAPADETWRANVLSLVDTVMTGEDKEMLERKRIGALLHA